MTSDIARITHVAIDAPAAIVYAYAANPDNLPRWAPGFARNVSRSGEDHVVETPDGASFIVRFAARNDLGVLDHWAYAPDGSEYYNPMRVVDHGAGSVLAFTLFRQDGWTEEDFARDLDLVRADLDRLKAVVEAENVPRDPASPMV